MLGFLARLFGRGRQSDPNAANRDPAALSPVAAYSRAAAEPAARKSDRTPYRRSALPDLPPVSAQPFTPSPTALLYSGTLGFYFAGVNWTNRAGFESPLVRKLAAAVAPPNPARLYSMTVRSYFTGVNWANSGTAPAMLAADLAPVDVAPESGPSGATTIDSVLGNFSWD
ncbi:MAG: hypothetical protein ACRDD1_19920 [Planctomycetia bacterium]